MAAYLLHIFVPMILANVAHMIIVKKDWFSRMSRPLAPRQFGDNKTWRGFIVLTSLNGIFFWMINLILPRFSQWEAIGMGALLGLTYMLFELPNSWLKRRLGIASGAQSSKYALGFMLLDKTDSALGVSLCSKILFGLDWKETLLLLLLSIGVHVFFSVLLVVTGVKKRF